MSEYFEFTPDMLSKGTSVPFHKFKNGKHSFRLLPLYKQGKWYHKVRLHWGFNKDGKKKSFLCPKTFEKDKTPCPICEKVDHLMMIKKQFEEQNNKLDFDRTVALINNIKAKPMYLINILFGEEVKVLQLSHNGFESLDAFVTKCITKFQINPFSPTSNPLLELERSGMNVKTKFEYSVATPPSIINVGQRDLFNLENIYKQDTYEKLNEALAQGLIVEDKTQYKTDDFIAKSAAQMEAPKDDIPNFASPKQEVKAEVKVEAPKAEIKKEVKPQVDPEMQAMMETLNAIKIKPGYDFGDGK